MPATLSILIIYVNVIPFYYLDKGILGDNIYFFLKYLPFLLSILLFGQVILKKKTTFLYDIQNEGLIHLLLCFHLWCILTLFFSNYSQLGLIKTVYYASTGGLVFLSIVFLKPDLKDLKKIAYCTVFSVTIVAIYGNYVYISSNDPLWTYLPLENKHYIISEIISIYENNHEDKHWIKHFKSTYRVVSTVGNEVVCGSLLSSAIPLILFFIFYSQKNTTKLFYLFAFFAVIFCTLLTFSRSAYISGSIGILFFLSIRLKKQDIIKIFTIKKVAILFIVSFLIVNLFDNSLTKASNLLSLRFEEMLTSHSVLTRIDRVKVAAYLVEENVLTGVGNAVLTDYIRENPHILSFNSSILTMDNMYLTILCEVGIVGTLLFLCVIFKAVIKPAWGLIKNTENSSTHIRSFKLACCGSIFSLIFNMTMWDLLNNPVMRFNFWLLVAVFFTLQKLQRPHK